MSLYNFLFDENPDANVLIGFLGLNKAIFGRYRNIFLNKDGDKIIVYTRCGGENRRDYDRVFEMMKRHPNYLRDYDDNFDKTYAYIEFSVPDRYKQTAMQIKPDKDPLTVWEQFQEHIRKSKENPNGPEAAKDNELLLKMMNTMNDPKPGLNIIEL